MTPAARTQAAIELLDAIILAAKQGGAAADTVIARYFAKRRYAGSKDRRAVRELVYAAIRALGERPVSGRAALLALAAGDATLAATFDGSPRGPELTDTDEPPAKRGVAPEWLVAALEDSGLGRDEIAALGGRAPLDIRINGLRATCEAIAANIANAEPIAGLPGGLRLPAGTNVAPLLGLIEVQDAGSQFVVLAAQARPGMRVLDLCAGGGGKTLALADMMRNEGAILATDTDRARLSRLGPRAMRAGASIVEMRLLDPGGELESLNDWAGEADLVVIDAPCSGTGTWRRNPEARWRLTPERLARFVAAQARLLEIGASLVRPGGAVVYIVCSLLDAEGAKQISCFLGRRACWSIDPLSLAVGRAHGAGLRLTPAHDATDGFFVARLLAPC